MTPPCRCIHCYIVIVAQITAGVNLVRKKLIKHKSYHQQLMIAFPEYYLYISTVKSLRRSNPDRIPAKKISLFPSKSESKKDRKKPRYQWYQGFCWLRGWDLRTLFCANGTLKPHLSCAKRANSANLRRFKTLKLHKQKEKPVRWTGFLFGCGGGI